MTNNEKVPATDKKRVRISSKRQITIPLQYHSMLGFENAAECVVREKRARYTSRSQRQRRRVFKADTG